MLETIYLCYISYLYHFPWISVKWIIFSTWISYYIVNLVFPNLDSPTYFPLPFLPVTSHIFSISINSFQGIFVQNFRATPTHSFFFLVSPLSIWSVTMAEEKFGEIFLIFGTSAFIVALGPQTWQIFYYISFRTAYSDCNYSSLQQSDVILSYFFH